LGATIRTAACSSSRPARPSDVIPRPAFMLCWPSLRLASPANWLQPAGDKACVQTRLKAACSTAVPNTAAITLQQPAACGVPLLQSAFSCNPAYGHQCCLQLCIIVFICCQVAPRASWPDLVVLAGAKCLQAVARCHPSAVPRRLRCLSNTVWQTHLSVMHLQVCGVAVYTTW